jgi:predicted house-cleaning noncanonical NTP pyrophosphatase (MazG superfamily)
MADLTAYEEVFHYLRDNEYPEFLQQRPEEELAENKDPKSLP